MKNVEKIIVISGMLISFIGIIIIFVMPGINETHVDDWLASDYSFTGLIWDKVVYNLGYSFIFMGIGFISLGAALVSEQVQSGAKEAKLYGSLFIIIGAILYVALALNDYNNPAYQSRGLSFGILESAMALSLIFILVGFMMIGAGSIITSPTVSANKVVGTDWVTSPDEKKE